MSLGWQCESALLPSKAKPINVDGKSMLGLLAVVAGEEKKISKALVNAVERPGSRRLNRQPEKNDLFLKKSILPEEYTHSNKSSDKLAKESKVAAALKAKAEIYDKLKEGVKIEGSQTFLVSFDNNDGDQRRTAQLPKAPTDVHTEIIDNDNFRLGRKRDYYGTFPNEDNTKYMRTIEDDKYEWSNGIPGSYDPLLEDNRRVQDFVEECIENEVKVSQHSRVRSQWEKTLKGDVKTFLEEVHVATEKDRLGHTGGGDLKRNSKDERRELLRLKRLNHSGLSDETKT